MSYALGVRCRRPPRSVYSWNGGSGKPVCLFQSQSSRHADDDGELSRHRCTEVILPPAGIGAESPYSINVEEANADAPVIRVSEHHSILLLLLLLSEPNKHISDEPVLGR